MIQIINGRKYNTDTATHLGTFTSNYSVTDFHYYEERLYRKRNGEYFLAGRGGARTRYAHQLTMNSWCGSKKIFPLSEQEAKCWAECHLEAEQYEEIFGEVEESVTTRLKAGACKSPD